MARKARKKTKTKAKAKKKPVARKKRKTALKKRRPAARKKTRKAKPKSLGGKIADAYHTVVDTVKGTDTLRNRLEQPGTSETE